MVWRGGTYMGRAFAWREGLQASITVFFNSVFTGCFRGWCNGPLWSEVPCDHIWPKVAKSSHAAPVLHRNPRYMKRNDTPAHLPRSPTGIIGRYPELGKNGRFGRYTGGASRCRGWGCISLHIPRVSMQNEGCM